MHAFSHQQAQSQQSSGEFSPARSTVLSRSSREQSLISNSRDHETVSSPLMGEVLRSPGQPLDAATRSFMEPRFGHDFSRVRVHTDAAAAASAREVGARAYTVGQHIVFGQGRSASALGGDRRFLAHELAHVVQQGQASDQPSSQGGLQAAPKHAEQSADMAASAVAAGGSAPPQPGQPMQLARQGDDELKCGKNNEFCPAPAAGSRPVDTSRPPPSVTKAPERKTETPSPAPPEKKTTTTSRAPVGTNGMFPDNTPTKELARWDYIVYQDHVRLGNRAVDEQKSGVIGSWPWMTNNPGDLTGDLNARKENAKDPNSAFRKDERIWGRPVSRGKSPGSLSPVSGSVGLDADDTAVEGFAARHDLAIFSTIGRGRKALKDWIQKYYANDTLAECIKKHLGPKETHVKGVDDPEEYPKLLQQYLTDKGGYPSNYVISTKGKDIKDDAWNDVIDAFGYAEGFYKRRPVAGAKGKFTYVENKGIIYRCGGRDPIDVDPAFKSLKRVTDMPQATPPEVKKLLGCP